jgi:endonuclease/exonuclease/phosphatase family metal-dependent hydrolase
MAYSQETQELTIASWNINGKGPSSERQKVLNHYLKKIKNKEDNFTPDIVFLQEVPWIGGGSITGPMLKGTCYSYTADSWVKEEGGPYNAVLHNETRMTAYNGGQIPIEFYRKLDEKREKVKRVHDKCDTDKKLQEAAKTNEEIAHVLTEFKDRASIAYFNDCFKRPTDRDVQRAEVVLKGRIAIGIFKISCSQAEPKIVAVSFHNRHPKKEPDKLLYLLLHFLKELHDLTGYPILLAGDFNMDVTKVKQSSLRRLIALFKPKEYTPTAHRGYLPCIDNIVLWDDRGMFQLGPIEAHLVDVPFACKEKNKTRDGVSNHDPLTTTLRMTKKEVKREAEDTCTMTTRPHPPTHSPILHAPTHPMTHPQKYPPTHTPSKMPTVVKQEPLIVPSPSKPPLNTTNTSTLVQPQQRKVSSMNKHSRSATTTQTRPGAGPVQSPSQGQKTGNRTPPYHK